MRQYEISIINWEQGTPMAEVMNAWIHCGVWYNDDIEELAHHLKEVAKKEFPFVTYAFFVREEGQDRVLVKEF